MIRPDTGRLIGLATKVLTQKAVERAHGGWIPEKQRVQQQRQAVKAQEKQKKEAEKRSKLQDGGVPDDEPYDLGQQLERGADIIRGTAQAQYERYGEPIVSGIRELMRPIQEGGGPESYQNPEMVGRALDVVGGMGAGSLLTGPSAAEMNVMRSGMGPVAKELPKTGIRAYHGSPHEFERFDLSKIGTGEGAQAYGHGLYFAEHEPVAQGYKDALRRLGDEISFDGKQLKRPRDYTEIQSKLENEENDWRLFKAVDEITKRQGNIDERLSDIRNWYRNEPEMLAAIDRAKGRLNLKENPGHMYEVSINAHPDHFFDWDKTLAEQHPHVQNRFIQAMAGNDPLAKELVEGLKPEDYGVIGLFPKSTGAQAYKTLADQIGGVDKASELLNNLGIKGIKYFDAGSRHLSNLEVAPVGKKEIGGKLGEWRVTNRANQSSEFFPTEKEARDFANQGTRNYVVFDPNDIEIMRRYAQGGNVTHISQHLATGGAVNRSTFQLGGFQNDDYSYAGNEWNGSDSSIDLDTSSDSQTDTDIQDEEERKKSIEDVMGIAPRGDYLLAGMDVKSHPVPDTYSVVPMDIVKQVRTEWPTATKSYYGESSPETDTQMAMDVVKGLEPYGLAYSGQITPASLGKPGVLTGDISAEKVQSTLKEAGVSPSTFKPVTTTSSATNWGKPAEGMSPNVSANVAPQGLNDLSFGAPKEPEEFMSGNSPLAAGIPSYDIDALQARNDAIKAGQQAARDKITTPLPIGESFSLPKETTTFGTGIRDVGFPSQKPVVKAPIDETSDIRSAPQTARKNFEQAFADARAAGLKTFHWTNPATGKTDVYTTALKRKEGGRVYPLADRDQWKLHHLEKDDSKLVHMEPDEFLDKAQKLEDTKDNHKDIKHWKKKIKKGDKLGPAALYTDGSQDGRHRVEAAKKMGIKKVPVLTWPERGTEPAKEYMKTATKIARKASKK